jgi:hypothetical protein
MTKKLRPDWEAIERAYRAGSVSVRSIAEAHDTSEGTIRSRAKAQGWQRDLTDQVRAATKDKISRNTSRTDFTQPDVREDAVVVEEASSARADVVMGQISRLSVWQGISQKLAKSLSEDEVTEENRGEFARCLSIGVDAELKLIKAERQAYGIDETPHEETYETRLARVMGDTGVAMG